MKKIRWAGLQIIRNRRILLVKEYKNDFYALPGGAIEKPESETDTIKREVEEELKTGVSKLKKHAVHNLPGKAEGVMIEFNVYDGDLTGKIRKGEEIESLEWVNSQYESGGINVSHLASMKVIPDLKRTNLID